MITSLSQYNANIIVYHFFHLFFHKFLSVLHSFLLFVIIFHSLQQELEEEKLSRILAQKAEAQAILQYQLAKTECDRLKRQLDEVKKQLSRSHITNLQSPWLQNYINSDTMVTTLEHYMLNLMTIASRN